MTAEYAIWLKFLVRAVTRTAFVLTLLDALLLALYVEPFWCVVVAILLG